MLDLEKEELEKFERGDKIVAEFREKLFELNENEGFINDFTKEQEAILMHNTAKKIAYKEGESSGMKQGRKEQQFEIASNLLNDGLSLERVSKNTGLSIAEIQQLQNSL